MPYVHLANGDVKTLDAKEMEEAFGEIGHQRAYRENGVEHQVIGIYPDSVEYDQSEDEKARDAENAQYQEWKRTRNAPAENVQDERQDENE